jgi:hypothetical protein
MSATPDSTLTDPQHIIADLQRQLAECKAERDPPTALGDGPPGDSREARIACAEFALHLRRYTERRGDS